jgi:hypothetical protein
MARAGRAEWAKRVQRWADSGLTAKEYAAETGLNPNTLAHWRWRLGAEANRPQPKVPSAPVKFVELAAEQAPTPAFFELVLAGGRIIRVPPSFDGAALVRLVRALEGVRA